MNGRRRPYTEIGVRRLRCVRCDAQAVHQWNACADGNLWRPLCWPCDVALNRLVLEWMGFTPDEVARKMQAYEGRNGGAM